ncbi:sialidase family protein [Noviherbaspirillum aerium]|uniref:sialidase family protein n=1 Tax=Noviherbaspirillum aerium TaxID=2588497 RepID=UPI001CEF7008|nr:sialidase family protein [Noviherbaspirillum aerium]
MTRNGNAGLPLPGRRHGPRWSAVLMALLCCAAVLAALAAEIRRWSDNSEESNALHLTEAAGHRQVRIAKLSDSLIPMPQGVPSAHASSLAPAVGDEMLAFWWAGSRESGPDVKIYSSRWQGGSWGAPREVASRESLGEELGFGIRRIGNPVAWAARDGTIHLFVVATGLGGWAASRIVHLVSDNHGEDFKVDRMLPMSPLFNTSVLVRTTPVGMADGGWWLPAYFELGIKYPMIMAFDDDGSPEWIARIGKRTTTLQPAIVPISDFEAYAWMRDASDEQRLQQAISRDGGVSWEDLPALDLPNHSTSVAALRLAGGGFVLLHNHVMEGGSSRNMLRLSYSRDARSWEYLFDVAHGDAGEEFSYPTLQQVGDELHVTYTSQRTAIAHHVYRIAYDEEPQ